MYKLVEDLTIGELSYRCAACGEKQYCYTDLPIITCCTKCFKMFNPHPYRLFFSQVYRKRYHLRKGVVNVVET
jgi:hypothetical protein